MSLDHLLEQLPQGPAFRFLDTILERRPQEYASAATTFAPTHRIFEGHLPGRPLVPGVIIIEALAQLAGIVALPEDGATPAMGFLARVDRVRFRRLVGPQERLVLEAELVQRLGSAARFRVRGTVAGEEAVSGELTLGGMGA